MLEIFPKHASKQNVINLHLKQLPSAFQFLEHRSSFFVSLHSGKCRAKIRDAAMALWTSVRKALACEKVATRRKVKETWAKETELLRLTWLLSIQVTNFHPKVCDSEMPGLDDRTALVVTWHRRGTRKPNAAKHVAALTRRRWSLEGKGFNAGKNETWGKMIGRSDDCAFGLRARGTTTRTRSQETLTVYR